MITTYREYKIKLLSGSTWISSETYQIVERVCEAKKGGGIISEVKIFSGSILDCESYLRLLDSGRIE